MSDSDISEFEPAIFGRATKPVNGACGVSGGGQKFTLQKGSHHLLLYLDATNTTTTQVMLTSDKADYIFYALDVTRVD